MSKQVVEEVKSEAQQSHLSYAVGIAKYTGVVVGSKAQVVATSAVCETLKWGGFLGGLVAKVSSAAWEEVAKGYESATIVTPEDK